jgi:hypothetical protein
MINKNAKVIAWCNGVYIYAVRVVQVIRKPVEFTKISGRN